MEKFLDLPINEITFSIVDVETTGLSPNFGDRVCEIGILRCKDGKEIESFSTLINPSRPISCGASAVNGITDEMVESAPFFREVATKVLELIKDSVIICHNAGFDMGFLESEFQRLLLSVPPAPVIDTLQIARRNYNFPSNSLSNIARYLGINISLEHRALQDVWTTFNIFEFFIKDLQKKGIVKNLSDLIFICGATYSVTEKEFSLPPFLEEAIRNNKKVQIKYVNADGGKSQRIIEPLEVSAFGDYIYLSAFCHLRDDVRTFRLDRIVEIRNYDEVICDI